MTLGTNFGLLFGAMNDIFTLNFAGAASKMMAAFGNVKDFFVRNFADGITTLVVNLREQFTWAFEVVATKFANFMKSALNVALKPLETFVNQVIGLINSVGGNLGNISLTLNGDQPIPNQPAWKLGTTTGTGLTNGVLPPLGVTTGTGLTSGVLPPKTTVPTVPTTPITADDFGNDFGGGSGGGAGGGAGKSQATQDVTDSFLESIKTSFSTALKTGDWKEFLFSIFDNIANNIIENFANGLIDGLAEGLGFGSKDGKGFFDGVFEGFGQDVQSGISGALQGSNFQDIFKNFGSGLKDMFGGMMSGLGGSFGGGGGGFGSLLSTGLSFLGFSDGGIVPHKPGFSRLGMDSVPAMLQPGEVVIPHDKVDSVLNRNGGGTNFNINITGDVDRQTERKIYEMAPMITQMVNGQNKENGY